LLNIDIINPERRDFMEFKEERAKFNYTYYCYLDLIMRSNLDSAKKFLDDCAKKGVTFDSCLYKKLVDDFETITINTKTFQLLPMGLINKCIPKAIVGEKCNYTIRGSINLFRGIYLNDPEFVPFYYPNDEKKPIKETFRRVCASYIEHYKRTLGETWSEDTFYKRLFELNYLSVKYAKDMETGEIFAIGFFGATIWNGANGKALTNAELYVMPEFRKMGIAKKMIGLTFEQAKMDGILNFDSITYRVQDNDSFAFWQSVGASASGLIHIEGNISDMLDLMNNGKIRK